MKKVIFLISCFFLMGMMAVEGQMRSITGKVVSSEDNAPILGVSVAVKGTTIGTVTNNDGVFSLQVPQSAQSLMFSFIGFRTKEVAIENQTVLNVTLEVDVFSVDEVVVVAYGIQQKRDVSGAIATVKGEEIKSLPVQSFDQALAGKAAGVSITLPNGVLNNPPVIRVRGFNSITSSSYPLIVVDGVPVFTGDVSSANPYSNALADINPSDIASMEILKDASATALFGSRAANGVIIITTKRGVGKTKVSYDGYVGYTQPYHIFEMMNAKQYIEHKNMAYQNAGLTTKLVQVNDANDKPIDTNWADEVYRNGFQHNHSVTVSGATPSTTYYLSAGFTDQDGMIDRNSYTRKNARFNMDHKLNRFLQFGVNIGFTNGFSEAPNTGASFATAGAARLAFVLPPIIAPYLNDGNYNINGSQVGSMNTGLPALGYFNPRAIIDLNTGTAETDRLLGSLYAAVEPVKGLFLKTVYGLDYLSAESITFWSPRTGDGYSYNGYAANTFNRLKRWTWTNTLNYSLTVKEKLNLALLAGTEEQRTVANNWNGIKQNVSDPFFVTYQGSWVTPQMGGGGQGENYFISYFGRFNTNYDKKYFFEASFRRDGFSGLSKNNKFGNFGGASLMWNISNEGFIQNSGLSEIFSDLRLKASYGRVGNMSGIGDFSSLFLYGSGLYGDVPTLSFSQAGNASLKWETSDKYDIGLSFGLLKDKIQVDINGFKNDINNLILSVPQSPSKGIPGNSIPANVGSMYNKGLEFSLTSYNISTKKFNWTTNFNITYIKNEVTALAPGVTEIRSQTASNEVTNITVVGKPVGNLLAVETRGVDPQTGRRIFVNKAGKEILYAHEAAAASRWTYKEGGGNAPAVTTAADAKAMGSPLPKFYGGLDNTVTFMNFDLALNLTYALDFKIYSGTKAGLRDQRWWNNSVEVYKTAWKKAGDVTSIPKPIMNDNVSNGSSFPISENIERGDYVKVRNISLGYTIKKLPDVLNIESIRLYGQVFNAFVFTKFSGSDPEVSTNGNSNVAPGIDRNTAPQARTVTFGVNVSF